MSGDRFPESYCRLTIRVSFLSRLGDHVSGFHSLVRVSETRQNTHDRTLGSPLLAAASVMHGDNDTKLLPDGLGKTLMSPSTFPPNPASSTQRKRNALANQSAHGILSPLSSRISMSSSASPLSPAGLSKSDSSPKTSTRRG